MKKRQKLTCTEVALRFLARRDYSRKELEVRLRSKGFTQSEISATLNRLEEENLINDYEFAKEYAKVLLNDKLLSNFAATERIVRRGVERQIASEAVMQVANDMPEEKRIELLLHKWRSGELAEYDNKTFVAKTRQKLLRRGFAFDAVNRSIERFVKEEYYNGRDF